MKPPYEGTTPWECVCARACAHIYIYIYIYIALHPKICGVLRFNFEVLKFHCFYILITYILGNYFVNKVTGKHATDWTVRESRPGGSEIFLAVRTVSEANPPRCTEGTGSFPGVRWSESVLTTHLPQVPGDRLVGAIPPPPLCTFTFNWLYE
jgi:hypothetical protein